MGCVFCEIVEGKTAAEILYENAVALAILDVNPIHHGHALILPKRHYRDFLEVPASELDGIMAAVHIVAKAIVKSLGIQGFNFFSNNGSIAGQSVFHFHIHVTPRYPDDNIRFVLQLKTYEGDAMGTMASSIRAAIDAPTRTRE